MKEKKFGFPVVTLIGAKVSVFLRVTFKYGIERKYFFKWLLSLIVSVISTILSLFDRLVYSLKSPLKNQKPPVFIIGHWRSGTTLLHNLMCLDPEAGYTTTFHSVFPNNIFAFKWLFKGVMRMIIPDKRPVDNVKLDVDYPQEEEFALNNEIPFSFYNWWYFPKNTKEIAAQYLLNETTSPQDWNMWLKNYPRFVDRCIRNTNGSRFISKNPPHTARIPQLLKLYPNAKFVFIHRNPYEVVQSTYAFYKSVLTGTQLQDIDTNVVFQDILNVYRDMIGKYEMDKKLISKENLKELSYKQLTEHPKEVITQLYTDLLQDDYERIKQPLKAYLDKQSHKLKTYEFQPEFVQSVNEKLSEIIEKQGYTTLD